jgi:RNA polymerase sigma-70 factor (ECF subfamily)
MDRGDDGALNELIEHFQERLEHLAAKMLRDYPRVRRWEAPDDVLQNALIRLSRALREVRPSSSKEFFGLARLQLRRELLNLAERYANRLSQSEASGVDVRDRVEPSKNEPSRLISLAEFEVAFQKQVDALAEPLREVFCLIWYDGLTQPEAAEFLGVSLRMVKYRWRDARIEIADALPDLHSQ